VKVSGSGGGGGTSTTSSPRPTESSGLASLGLGAGATFGGLVCLKLAIAAPEKVDQIFLLNLCQSL